MIQVPSKGLCAGTATGDKSRTARSSFIRKMASGCRQIFYRQNGEVQMMLAELLHPDAGRGGLAEVNRPSVHAQGHGFVVLAFQYIDRRRWTQVQSIQEFQKLRILLVHAQDFA